MNLLDPQLALFDGALRRSKSAAIWGHSGPSASDARLPPLTLVSAPAGYGKTTLISHWLETLDRPSAWLSLDEDDDDLILFLTYLLAAIETMVPDAVADTRRLLRTATLPPLSVLARSLINALDQIDCSFILVLDDYHYVHNVAIHDLLNLLLAHRGPSSTLGSVFSRSVPRHNRKIDVQILG